MTLLQAEEKLSTHLGDCYLAKDWYPALKAVIDAEGDVIKAQKALHEISVAYEHPKLTIKVPARSARLTQLAGAEKAIASSVQRLKDRNRIFGEMPTINDIIDPVDEREDIKDSPYAFSDGETGIIKQVDTFLTPYSTFTMTDLAVESLPTLFLAYCALNSADQA